MLEAARLQSKTPCETREPIALAEALEVPLVTLDEHLARAPRLRGEVIVPS